MSRATAIAATLVEADEFGEDAAPGSIRYAVYGAVPDAKLYFTCPCGCGGEGMLYVRPFPGKPFWSNLGTRERPSTQPSIGFNGGPKAREIESDGYHWHGYLVDGVWQCVYAGRA